MCQSANLDSPRAEHAPWFVPTKLAPPRVSRHVIARPRLLREVDRGVNGPLTLIVAPAGFGKTTLAAQWCATRRQTGKAVAWVSLDARDDDSGRFWTYLLLAVEPHLPSNAPDPLGDAGSSDPPVALLLQALAAPVGELFVVLDDFHEVENPAIHTALTDLIEHLPPHV